MTEFSVSCNDDNDKQEPPFFCFETCSDSIGGI